MKKEIIKATSLDFAILGMITHEPLSGYGIRKVFETTAMGNYSNSPGTIYPALKRMQKFELIENYETKEDGKKKFHITKKGEDLLKEWLIRPLKMNDVERKLEEVFLRFAFMDIVPEKESKISFLESFRDLLKRYLKQLQDYHKAETKNLPLHGRLSFEYGIESYKTALKWCNKTLLVFTKK
jgi:DNA-binding PadR family transcriptional regulator